MDNIYRKSRQACWSTEGLKRTKGRTNCNVFHRAVKKKARNDVKMWERKNKEDY